MRSRQGTASIVASPVLVGAVTVLVTIVAIFLAYNANAGLPFVPTYDVKAQLPNGAKLVKGNDVRLGGFRVGLVESIEPATVTVDGKRTSVALIEMRLDKTVEPLAADTLVKVRPRSALGLKYIELTPGKSEQTVKAGATVPLKFGSASLDLEDVYSTFPGPVRDDARAATEGFGDAFAGRGQSLNEAIAALNPLFRSLTPVMQSLSDPDTQLDQFFRQIGATAAQVAPVAAVQAQLFTNMADTFAAIVRDPAALQATIEKSPPTLDTAIRSFVVQRPFLADFADLSRRLRPAAAELPRSLPRINAAFKVGTPVLPRSVRFNEQLEASLRELDDLFDNPNTLLALKELRTSLAVARPAVEYIAPYQTVCNLSYSFLHSLGEVQSQTQSGDTGGGTVLQQGGTFPNFGQANNYGTIESSRPVDVPPDKDPHGATDALGTPLHRLYGTPYPPAIDAQGNADCQAAQLGYVKGPFNLPGFRVPPGLAPDGAPTGGNFSVTANDFPVLTGGTYVTRKLGIKNLSDVP